MANSQMDPATLLVACLIIYVAPALIAKFRDHHNLKSIAATNILLGWTFLGWVVALIWSLSSQPRHRVGL